MPIALFAFDATHSAQHPGDSTLQRAMSWPGVTTTSVFSRVTPDKDPFAATLGGRYLAIFALADGPPDPAPLIARLERLTDARLVGSFDRLTSYQRRDGQSDLSAARGILVVMMNNMDVMHEKAFNDWYDETHLPDVVNAAGFWIGVRYRNCACRIRDGGARYLAIYETEMHDVILARAPMLELVSEMDIWPHIEQVHVAEYAAVALEGGLR